MKKTTTLQKILIFLIGITITFTIISGFFTSNTIGKYGYDVLTMSKYYLLQSPFQTVKDTLASFSYARSLQEENKQLKQEALVSSARENENKELRRQIEELTKLNEMQNTNANFKYVSGEIIGRDIDAWNDQIVINVGENHQIEKGMVVVGDSGIIGVIASVSKLTSKVTLITSTNSINQIAAKIELNDNESVDGIVNGYNRKENAMQLRISKQDLEVKEGSTVITSGIGKKYPAGLTIGTVKKQSVLKNELGQELLIEIAQDLDKLQFISVIVGSK